MTGKKIVLYFVVLTLLFQLNCLHEPKEIDQLWFYSYSGHTGENENIITPASFIDLESDGTYTRDFGTFEQGSWNQKQSTLVLVSKGGTTIIFPIKVLRGNELQLISAKGTVLNFEGLPRQFASLADNPFSAENNTWRIHPTKKESDREIKERLKNHFRFYELYITWALNNEFGSIDVNSTPSPIKIYGNGFALKPVEQLPASWLACFYDHSDCERANSIIKDIFEHHDIAWATTTNKFKMFISAFQQLQQQLH